MSIQIAKNMCLGDVTKKLIKTSTFTPESQKHLQETILPIIMCCYAHEGNYEGILNLCKLNADVNMGDYDGKKI